MILSVEINNRRYEIDWENALDISIPLDFNQAQPNAYSVESATSEPYETGNLIGDTRRGGSCNFEQIKFVPHCNGTHTESIGHLTDERISIHESLKDTFIRAALVSVEIETAAESDETYPIELDRKDKLITRRALENALPNSDDAWLDALIVRTLPNADDKKSRVYAGNDAPFFSTEAMNFLAEKNIKHLLFDAPSIDRADDAGKLSNHRIFWNVRADSRQLSLSSFPQRTITEMIFVADEIEDGAYLLNLQIAAFVSDAAPSRPRLFRISAPQML